MVWGCTNIERSLNLHEVLITSKSDSDADGASAHVAAYQIRPPNPSCAPAHLSSDPAADIQVSIKDILLTLIIRP